MLGGSIAFFTSIALFTLAPSLVPPIIDVIVFLVSLVLITAFNVSSWVTNKRRPEDEAGHLKNRRNESDQLVETEGFFETMSIHKTE